MGDPFFNDDGHTLTAPTREERPTLMHKRSLGDNLPDPMEAMGNLFDVAILIGVGFMIVSVTSMGLKGLFSNKDMTVVKNPNSADMEIITKSKGKITTLKRTSTQAQGMGTQVGAVYKLADGRMVWIPDASSSNTTGTSSK